MGCFSNQTEDDDNLDKNLNERKIDPPEEETNITDLMIECQEKIFSYLSFKNIVNVGISSPYLREAAKTVIKRKYGGIDTKTVETFTWINLRYIWCNTNDDQIQITGLKNILQFLRCFGDKISKLNVDYHLMNSIHRDHIDQYISQYCSDHLIDLNIKQSSNVLASVDNPFKNLHNLYIHSCNLGYKFRRFPQFFPELRRLVIVYSKRFGCVNANKNIIMEFPKLKHLRIDINYNDRLHDLSLENVKMISNENPQLNSFKIKVLFDEYGQETDIKKELHNNGLQYDVLYWGDHCCEFQLIR